MTQQEEYKVVGVDASGNPLYQKVVKSNGGSKYKQAAKGVHARMSSLDGVCKVGCESDFLYSNLNPEVVKLRHNQSQEQFPEIKFMDKEFVLRVIHRHPIGVVIIWLVAALITMLLVGIWAVLLVQNSQASVVHDELFSLNTGMLIIGSIIAIALIFAVIFSRVYRANKLIITTERVVQVISNSLFDTKRQTIDLGWIEDVSYHQRGFFAAIVGYGSLRLSTIGDETTYYFIFTPDPQAVNMKINEIVFAVKNERPLTEQQIQ